MSVLPCFTRGRPGDKKIIDSTKKMVARFATPRYSLSVRLLAYSCFLVWVLSWHPLLFVDIVIHQSEKKDNSFSKIAAIDLLRFCDRM
jgi:hypothetical protein